MSNIKQLDSLRAIAILLVIITHWFPSNHILYVYTSVFSGVDIFFVISGFLITKILLNDRQAAEEFRLNKISMVKMFLAKRMLRIFPVYYLVLCLLFIFGTETATSIRANFLYFFSFTSNFLFFRIQRWDGMLSHLWSLSVQEHFYFFWPLLILFTPKKYLLFCIVFSVMIGALGQIIFKDIQFGDILTFNCLDGFGMGALLAFAHFYKPEWLDKFYNISWSLALICFLLQVLRVISNGEILLLPSRTLTSIFTVWLIAKIILSKEEGQSIFKKILNNKVLLKLGKVSYGLYLYHLIIPHFTKDIFTNFNSLLPFIILKNNFYLVQIENLCLLLIISFVSWRFIEQPLLKFKKYFNNHKFVSADIKKELVNR